jgi:hypothetical protein
VQMLEQADDPDVVQGWHPTVPLLERKDDAPAVDGVLPTVPVFTWSGAEAEPRLHTAVLEPADDAPVPTGRHRARRTVGRTVALRAGLVAGGLLVAAAIGVGGADALGLTGSAQPASGDASVGESDVLPVAPELERTVDVHSPPARRPAPPPPPAAAPRTPAPQPPAEPAPQPGTAEAPSPAPAAAVRVGKPCSTKGATGMTDDGERMVCRGGHGRPRWRLA